MNLVQYINDDGNRGVGRVLGPDTVEVLDAPEGVYGLARRAIVSQTTLEAVAEDAATGVEFDYGKLVDEGRLLPPIDHVDPAHLLITGTGLTHLGTLVVLICQAVTVVIDIAKTRAPVIVLVTRRFERVPPKVRGQIGMTEIDAGVQDRDQELLVTGPRVPHRRRVY